MSILTRKELASTAAGCWKSVYMLSDGWCKMGVCRAFNHPRDYEEVYNDLIALGESPEPNDVDAIIGNGSWTRLTCDHCKRDVDRAVGIGSNWICFECLNVAHQQVSTVGGQIQAPPGLLEEIQEGG